MLMTDSLVGFPYLNRVFTLLITLNTCQIKLIKLQVLVSPHTS